MSALLLTFWKPLAAILAAVLAALGLYAKGRADAKGKADLKDAKAANATFERIENAPVHSDADRARDRMRSRPERQS